MSTVFEYIDESGQDTIGLLFIVGILVTDSNREALLKLLEQTEKESKKGNRKWHGSDPKYREAYLGGISRLKELAGKLFVKKFVDRNDYMTMTVQAAAEALRTQHADKAVVYIDGLRESQIPKFKRQLKPSIQIPVKVRGVRRDENNAFIRLADAICGAMRDAEEGNAWAKKIVRRLMKRSILTKL